MGRRRDDKKRAAEEAEAALLAAFDAHPPKHLGVIDTEIQRQRDLMGRRIGNSNTRATVLIGAAGVLGGVGVSTSIAKGFVVVALVSVLFYVTAAIFGLRAFRPMSGDEVDVEAAILQTTGKTVEGLRRSFLASHLKAHEAYEESLKIRARWITAGFIALGIAWLLGIAGTTLGVLHPDPTSPVHVIIDK